MKISYKKKSVQKFLYGSRDNLNKWNKRFFEQIFQYNKFYLFSCSSDFCQVLLWYYWDKNSKIRSKFVIIILKKNNNSFRLLEFWSKISFQIEDSLGAIWTCFKCGYCCEYRCVLERKKCKFILTRSYLKKKFSILMLMCTSAFCCIPAEFRFFSRILLIIILCLGKSNRNLLLNLFFILNYLI